jgi:hypothetical protein
LHISFHLFYLVFCSWINPQTFGTRLKWGWLNKTPIFDNFPVDSTSHLHTLYCKQFVRLRVLIKIHNKNHSNCRGYTKVMYVGFQRKLDMLLASSWVCLQQQFLGNYWHGAVRGLVWVKMSVAAVLGWNGRRTVVSPRNGASHEGKDCTHLKAIAHNPKQIEKLYG